MNIKKIIIIILSIAAMFVLGRWAKNNNIAKMQQAGEIESYLENTYLGEFNLISDEAIKSDGINPTYEYRFVTDDDRAIEFSAYYKLDNFFSRNEHITSDLDYAVAEYVIANSQYADGDYDITYVSTQEVTDDLYELARKEQDVLEEYGLMWFSPLLDLQLVYRDVEFGFSFSSLTEKETIYIGLNRNIMEIEDKIEDSE